jgi:hypothetical protein
MLKLPAGWKLSPGLSAFLPSGIQAYEFDSIFEGRTTKAVCVVYDCKSMVYELKPVLAAASKKPSQFLADEGSIAYACINGGYFGGNQSFSLVRYNNVVSAPNIKSVSRSFSGSTVPYYPTRAAFGLSNTGAPSVAWVYNVGSGNDLIYRYPAPSSNAEGAAPQAIPTETFPAGGMVWNVTAAIGGSPVLLKGGQVNITDVQELINVNNTSNRPRSAIGYTSDGIVTMLAVEGDNTAAGYPGINLAGLANMLKALGCTDAINLDGGGSTSLVVGNKLTVRPGDSGVERPVVSAVVLKRR